MQVNKSEMYSRRPLVTEIKLHMAEVQNLFIKLLSDPKSKHLSREACCLGLAACRGLTKTAAAEHATEGMPSFGSEELNHRLLRAFGQTTNFGGSAYQETAQQASERRAAERDGTEQARTGMEQFGEESEVGGASGLGEAALNSYKEMASGMLTVSPSATSATSINCHALHLRTRCWKTISFIKPL
jgi:proteasome component ECM29